MKTNHPNSTYVRSIEGIAHTVKRLVALKTETAAVNEAVHTLTSSAANLTAQIALIHLNKGIGLLAAQMRERLSKSTDFLQFS